MKWMFALEILPSLPHLNCQLMGICLLHKGRSLVQPSGITSVQTDISSHGVPEYGP